MALWVQKGTILFKALGFSDEDLACKVRRSCILGSAPALGFVCSGLRGMEV